MKSTIEQINIVIRSLIPDIRIEIYNAFEKLTEKGKDGIQFEVITIRGRQEYRCCMSRRALRS